MSNALIAAIILALTCAGFLVGRARAMADADGDKRNLHSLPVYYGANVGLSCIVPALAALVIWMLAQPLVINNVVSGLIPESEISEGSSLNLVMSDVRRVADGLDVAIEQGALTPAEAATLDPTTTDIRGMLGAVGVALGSEVTPSVMEAPQA